MVFRKIRDLITGFLCCLLIPTTALAIPVGDFSWNEHNQEECDAGLCGAFFSVGNFSDDPEFSLGLLGDSFLDVFVDLQIDAGPQSLALGDIAPGGSSQSIEDLFGTTIASASLRMTFGNPTLPGFLQLLDIDGNIVTALTAPGALLIDYVAETVAPVPEPSVLLLFASGLIGVALRRRAPRRDASPGARA